LAGLLLGFRSMNQKARELRTRTHKFFTRVIAFCGRLPNCDAVTSIRGQLLASAGSVDSNYRGACRGRSRAEFTAKIGVAAEEADEAKGWLEALVAAGIGDSAEANALIQEADELTAIFVASQKTARRNSGKNDRR
jgi:four helix bundle protein